MASPAAGAYINKQSTAHEGKADTGSNDQSKVRLIEKENLRMVCSGPVACRSGRKKLPLLVLSSGKALVFLVLTLFFPCATAADGKECYRIRQILIQRLDVFEGAKKDHWYFKLVQALHVTSRESIIRRELLFTPNDCYDADLVAETERNLRQNKIFSDAEIKATFNEKEHFVDLTVITYDRFTLRLNLGVSRKGGINKLRVSLGESNFLGYNKEFHYTYISRSDGTRIKRFAYRDPRLANLLKVNLLYSSTDEGVYQALGIGKPFRSLDQPNAWFLSYFDDQTSSDLYSDGGEEIEIPNKLKAYFFDWSRELGNKVQSRRLSLRTGYHEDSYHNVPSGLTVPEATKGLPLLLVMNGNNRGEFAVRSGVDSLIKREDIALHGGVTFGGGGEWRERGGSGHLHGLLSAGFSQVGTPTEQQLNSTVLQGQVRFYAGEAKATELSGFYHHYFFHDKIGSLVGGLTVDYRFTKDDLYLPLTLGEDRGLRGYEAFSFTGNKLALINLEHRYTYPWRSRHWAFGQVLFVDGGSAWKPGQSMDPSDLHWGAGLGFRLDNPSILGNKLVRVDLAWPLDGGNPSISFSLGQVFQHNSVNRGFDRDF